MKILSGAYRKDAGEIRIDGQPVEIDEPARRARARHPRHLSGAEPVPQLSVAENIFLGSMATRGPGLVDWKRLYAETAALLADLGLDLDPRTRVARLGLAQRQMVEIAKALRPASAPAESAGASARLAGAVASAGQAAVLVMDEPTSALTSREVTQLFALIERLAARGVGDRLHHAPARRVFRIGHRITVLRDGRHITTRPIGEVTVAELVRLMANRDLTDHFPKVPPRGPELLRVEHLSRQGALADVSFSGPRGRSRRDRGPARRGPDRTGARRFGCRSVRQRRRVSRRGAGPLPQPGRCDRARHRAPARGPQGARARRRSDDRAEHCAAARTPARARRRAAARLRIGAGGADRRGTARERPRRRRSSGC
jgi:ABC-type branched-subunit amino acid transport system ATPase component